MIRVLWGCVLVGGLLACDSDFKTPAVVLVDLGINPVGTENTNTSYHRSKALDASSMPLIIDYSTLTATYDATRSNKAIAYLDAEDDLDTDIFFAMAVDLNTATEKAELYIYDSTAMNYTDDADTFFTANVPTSVNASKSLVSDFTGDGLDDIFIVDQANDVSTHIDEPKFLIHRTELSDPSNPASALIHSFGFQIFSLHEGNQTSAASADIDNDGDTDIFVGGSAPFFYINNSLGGFTRVNNRWDNSMSQVDAVELVDIDQDGYVDLIAGADEVAGIVTSIYWGNATGTYNNGYRTQLPAYSGYGVILDFEVENLDADSNRDIVIYRTSAADTDRVVQLIKNNGGRVFADVTSTQIDNPITNTTSNWLRAQDRDNDGDIDIFPDNDGAGFWYQNDAAGNFTKQ